MTLGLRWRLTLVYTGLLAAAFVIFALLLHAMFARSLDSQLDARLATQTQGLAEVLRRESAEHNSPSESGGRDREDAGADVSREDEEHSASELGENSLLAADLYLQLLNPRGRTVYASGNLGAARLVQDHSVPRRAREFSTLSNSTLGRVRCYSLPVTLRSGAYTLIAAAPLAPVESALHTLDRVVLLALPLTLAFVGLVGYAAAARALHPVAAITSTAQAIRSGDLNRRIALRGPDDELRRLADTFDEMIAALQQLVDAQRQFLADASHELRTPLAVILSALEVNLRAPDGNAESPRETMRLLLEEARRMKRLVNDLLTLARADMGEQPLQLEAVDLGDLLKEVLEAGQWMMGPRRLRLELNGEATALADPDRLRQLLLNLLDNAAKHTGPDGQISLTLATTDGHAQITVADDGEGIPGAHLSRLFDRFYRVDGSRSRVRGGTGLGLAICRWIAEAHHGRLTVDSALGRGTSFTLSLPLCPR
jgi:two-component system OmpR family sensor kinase